MVIPTKHGNDDFALLDEWCRGNAAAGEAIYQRHFSAVYRFLRNKVNDELEDLVQQTFLACVEGRSRFRREASFRVYLLQIARYQLYAHYRRRQRNPHLNLGETSVRDLGTSPTGMVARRQETEMLLSALRELPIDQQTAIELKFWEELTRDEMAAVLGVPAGTVASRLRRARDSLRESMIKLERQKILREGTADDLDACMRAIRDELNGSRQ